VEYKIIANPDGTISTVPVNQQQGIMVPAYETSQLDLVDQINEGPRNIGVPMNLEETMAGGFLPPDPRRFQSIFPSRATGITASTAAVPFGSPEDVQQGFTQNTPSDTGTNFRFLESANEDEQDEVKQKSGIAKLFEFLQQFSPLRGMAALSDKLKQSSMYRPSTTGVFGYTPAQLNQMNALGGYYSEPERERRRRANRISNMLQRAAAGKNYSQKNLSNLMNQFGMGDVDTGGMIQSIKESSNMGYGRGDVGQAATPGRDYSSSPGAMAGDMEYGEE